MFRRDGEGGRLPGGMQPWESDGTVADSRVATSVSGGLSPTGLTDFDGKLSFQPWAPADGTQLFTSNGTSAGTMMDTSLAMGNANVPGNLAAAGLSLVFTAPGPRCGAGRSE